nr:uncharacterized protein LOC126516542 [Dermacentor andersoni]
MVVPYATSDLGVAGSSLSSEVRRCYQLGLQAPSLSNAFMQFALKTRRSLAAMNANENNQPVSSSLAKLWHPLNVADKGPFQRKVAEATDVHRRECPVCGHNPREARRRKKQELSDMQVTSKLKIDTSLDKEQQPSTSMVAAQGRGMPKFQQQLHPAPLLPTRRSKHRATISAARVSASVTGQGKLISIPAATVPSTTKVRSAVRPYCVHRCCRHPPPLLQGANKGSHVGSVVLLLQEAVETVSLVKITIYEFTQGLGFASMPFHCLVI